MIAEGGYQRRLDSAFLAKGPEVLDIINDIFIPGKTETFKSQLRAFLGSREIMWVITERPPTMYGIAETNPQASSEQVQDAFDMIMTARQGAATKLSVLLPQFIKASSLSYNYRVSGPSGHGVKPKRRCNLRLYHESE